MKLAISNIAWEDKLDREMYSLLAELKIEGLEIAPTRLWPDSPYDKIKEAAQYARELKENYGLAVCSMQSIWYGMNQKLFGTKEEREQLLEYTRKAILFAEEIECGNLVFGCPRNRVIPLDEHGKYCEEDLQRAIEFFRKAGEFAKEHNTVLAMEANPPIYNTNFINKTQEAVDLVRQVQSEGFRVNGDFGTIIENEESLECVSSNSTYFNHFHISEPGLAYVSQRDAHRNLSDILREAKYAQYVSVEMKKTEDMNQIKTILEYIISVFR